jgi:hypothetical protein
MEPWRPEGHEGVAAQARGGTLSTRPEMPLDRYTGRDENFVLVVRRIVVRYAERVKGKLATSQGDPQGIKGRRPVGWSASRLLT